MCSQIPWPDHTISLVWLRCLIGVNSDTSVVRIRPWLHLLCAHMHDMSKQHYMHCHVVLLLSVKVMFRTTISHSSSPLCLLPCQTQDVQANGKDGKTQQLRIVWTHVFWASTTAGLSPSWHARSAKCSQDDMQGLLGAAELPCKIWQVQLSWHTDEADRDWPLDKLHFTHIVFHHGAALYLMSSILCGPCNAVKCGWLIPISILLQTPSRITTRPIRLNKKGRNRSVSSFHSGSSLGQMYLSAGWLTWAIPVSGGWSWLKWFICMTVPEVSTWLNCTTAAESAKLLHTSV